MRRSIPLSFAPVSSEEEDITLDQWIDVPSDDGALLAAPALRLTTKGQLMKTALRIPPVYIEFEFADGETERVRILPESSARGILVNHPPLTWSDAVKAFAAQPGRSVARFRITGPGTRYYDQRALMTLTKLKQIVRSHDQLARLQMEGS